jgi:hypothetical protein
MYFLDETFTMVKNAVKNHWSGTPPLQAGLYSDTYLMATILDPAFSPKMEDLPDGWFEACRSILERFYHSEELTAAENELLQLVDRQGRWGAEVEVQQERLCSHMSSGSKYVVQKIAAMQVATSTEKPHLRWKLVFSEQFLLLYQIARRILIVSTQSADVERVCKAHKVVHIKVRNRLKNQKCLQASLLLCQSRIAQKG